MKPRTFTLISAALLAAGLWTCASRVGHQGGPVYITLKLGYSSPLSRQYFEKLVLYTKIKGDSTDTSLYEPMPMVPEPGRKMWGLDRVNFRGTELDLRDNLGILMPWKREVLKVEFDNLVRQGRDVNITVGGNIVGVSFRIGDRKLGEPEYLRYTLIGGFARLLAPETGPDAHWAQWRLVERSVIIKDCTCQFTLISPGDYRVELLNSAGAVMLAGPLHVPADSELIQKLEAQVERP